MDRLSGSELTVAMSTSALAGALPAVVLAKLLGFRVKRAVT